MYDELAKAIAAFYRIYNRKTPDISIKSSEMGLLMFFFENPGLTAKDASDFFKISKPSVTVPLQSLEKQQLIYREQDKNDKRKFGIYLSDHGTELITEMVDAYNQYARKLEAQLGVEKATALLELLSEAIDILEEH